MEQNYLVEKGLSYTGDPSKQYNTSNIINAEPDLDITLLCINWRYLTKPESG